MAPGKSLGLHPQRFARQLSIPKAQTFRRREMFRRGFPRGSVP
jgi:hypothetical protein